MDGVRKFMKKETIKRGRPAPKISKRSGYLTPDEQAKSLVAVRRIDGTLENTYLRVPFGRHGTEKTHILSYVSSFAHAARDVPPVVDLRTLGSDNSIHTDGNLDSGIYATRRVRDLISTIRDRLLDHGTLGAVRMLTDRQRAGGLSCPDRSRAL